MQCGIYALISFELTDLRVLLLKAYIKPPEICKTISQEVIWEAGLYALYSRCHISRSYSYSHIAPGYEPFSVSSVSMGVGSPAPLFVRPTFFLPVVYCTAS
jgi:hypothetical protein